MATLEELRASISNAKMKAAEAKGEEITTSTSVEDEGEEIQRKSQSSISGTGKAGR